MTGLIAGGTYPFRALALFLRKPAFLTYLFFPLLLNVVLGIGLYLGIFAPSWQWINTELSDFNAFLAQWEGTLPPWLGFLDEVGAGLGWVFRIALSLGLFLLIGLLLAQFGTLLGAPWYGKLSEKIEQFKTQQMEIVEIGPIQEVRRAVLFELKKLLLLLVVGGTCFIVNTLPGLGSTIATIGGFSLGSTLVCLDFLDSPLERRRLKFRQKLGLIYGTLPATASFGLVSLFLVSIPLLNLITVPLCVASGTLFFCDRIWPKHFKQQTPSASAQN
ncbi:EI24 domain-containing protein [Altericista sp. CCNU0014]|uniref:EI24 domain-containing protein n=1 Tax=Altericista sp. CCNU0014 TaxID=3082949 RepID=UPI00384D56AD